MTSGELFKRKAEALVKSDIGNILVNIKCIEKSIFKCNSSEALLKLASLQNKLSG